LADLADRAEVMDAITDWFGGCQPGANPACVLLVDDDQSLTFSIYLPLILK
jgi:hypothetical protein